MNSINRTARIVGALYIIGTVAGILSLVFRGPIGNVQDFLISVSANETRLVVGALFVLTMSLALAMVPVMMFPILRKHNEALALGYVVFRGGLEAVSYLAIATIWLLLVPLSQLYVQAGASDASNIQALGTLLLEAEKGIVGGVILTIAFSLGSLIFNYLLYQTKLVPRWLSAWGLIAGVLYLASGLLAVFGIIEALSPIFVILQLPKALQEMVLAVWLIVKGFNPYATVLLRSTREERVIDAVGKSAEVEPSRPASQVRAGEDSGAFKARKAQESPRREDPSKSYTHIRLSLQRRT